MTVPRGPLAQSPLHLLAQPAWIKTLALGFGFVLFAGGILAVWLVLPASAQWRRRFRERQNIKRALRSTRWG